MLFGNVSQPVFLKNSKKKILMFLDRFDVLISKIIFKK
jgi:hypothetical protein